MIDADTRTVALAWHDAGTCVLPAASDGTKRPALDWKTYQQQRPSREQVEQWFAGRPAGIGVVCGQVSGNLEMLELEGRAVTAGALNRIAEAVAAGNLTDLWERITLGGYAEHTPSGGLHLLYRVADQPVPGNTKLARNATGEVLAETRGEGGWVVVAPSHGTTHPTGREWTCLYGNPAAVPTITADERQAIHAIIRSLDETPPPAEPAPTQPRLRAVDGGLAPGDDFEQRVDWADADLLGGAGWRLMFTHGGRRYWQRPGKDGRGISATTGGAADGRDRLYVFTTSTDFESEKPYTKFGAYALLHHGGNYSAAAKALRAFGFGKPAPSSVADLVAPRPRLAVVDGTSALASEPAPEPATKRPIKLSGDADTIRQVQDAINTGALPDTYVTNGELVELTRVSGDSSAAGLAPAEQPPLPVIATNVSPDGLAALLAHHTYTYRTKRTRDGDTYDEEITPPSRTLAAVLSRRYWPGVQPLHGIVGSPVLRPDGTLLQKPGYDQGTGLYLAPTVHVPHVPERPDRDEVVSARSFLLEAFLGDFPWVEPADRANYIGLLIAQILRPYLRTITPFGLITASAPSSGKTILSEGVGLLFGQRVRTWVRSEGELRKAITAVLDENAPTVVFDNVPEGEIINSATLAMLITTPVWTDRLLGTNKTFTAANDRLWLSTGNNLRLGGDMATRTVLVRLDPKMPHPELRTGFTIPDLDRWVKNPANRTVLLRHLLVLVMDWIANGAASTAHTMRQFTTWAAATGGFLAHHDIAGFLDNAGAVHELDEQKSEWISFLGRWYELYGSTPKLAREIRQSAEVEYEAGRVIDRWQGDFITDGESNLPKNAVALSARLRGHIDRYYGDYVLRAKRDTDKNVTWWWVDLGGDQA